MNLISIAAVMALTGQSERTLRRKIADGSLPKVELGNLHKVMIPIVSIQSQLCIPVSGEEWQLVLLADGGDAQAQTDLALLLLEHGKESAAVPWLEQAAKQGDAEAMYWLGRLHLDAGGVAHDDNLGMMWLARSAAAGSLISKQQMQVLREKVTAADRG
ncbi:sel1 repeat family protein [Noviherbaspirillum galbum]|uniref:Sel1 repeat family protein n=1 Tax=Noviherbaspirillum galbum TaxID=2709383 RepID=A0A6B3SGK3_9BURK|nr:sel1 repeat family protein [Noviherbaspirillum galbum]NEX60007.1 sel1 repeat family protein [Noviherbaspirillum galbum]